MWTRRGRGQDLVAVLVVVLLALSQAQESGAAVVCQRKQKVRLRANACNPKETLLVDLTSQRDRLKQVGDQGETLQRVFGLTCPGDPSRTLVSRCDSSSAATTGRGGGISPCRGTDSGCNGACRRFDGNAAGCGSAFQTGSRAAAACVYLDGKCYGCADCAEPAGRCHDACSTTPQSCPGAPARQFVGSDSNCFALTTQGTCEASWAQGNEQGISCYWAAAGGRCRACRDFDQSTGACTNSCLVVAPQCADPTRSLGQCFNAIGQPACEATWQIDSLSSTACWWNAGAGNCQSCDAVTALAGLCQNPC